MPLNQDPYNWLWEGYRVMITRLWGHWLATKTINIYQIKKTQQNLKFKTTWNGIVVEDRISLN